MAWHDRPFQPRSDCQCCCAHLNSSHQFAHSPSRTNPTPSTPAILEHCRLCSSPASSPSAPPTASLPLPPSIFKDRAPACLVQGLTSQPSHTVAPRSRNIHPHSPIHHSFAFSCFDSSWNARFRRLSLSHRSIFSLLQLVSNRLQQLHIEKLLQLHLPRLFCIQIFADCSTYQIPASELTRYRWLSSPRVISLAVEPIATLLPTYCVVHGTSSSPCLSSRTTANP